MNIRTTLLWHVGVTLISALSLMLTACAVTPSSTGGAKTGDTGTMRPASEKVLATPAAVEQAWVQLAMTERAIANDWQKGGKPGKHKIANLAFSVRHLGDGRFGKSGRTRALRQGLL